MSQQLYQKAGISKMQRYVRNYILENGLIEKPEVPNGPLNYKWTDSVTLDNTLYRVGDMVSLCYFTTADIYSTAGTFIITYGLSKKNITVTLLPVASDGDVTAQFNQQVALQYQSINKAEPNILRAYPKLVALTDGTDQLPGKFTKFALQWVAGEDVQPGETITANVVGPVRQIYGFRKAQEVLSADAPQVILASDSTLLIKRLRLSCDQVSACFRTFQNNQMQFSNSTLAVVDRQNDFMFESKNLDVQHAIIASGAMQFKLLADYENGETGRPFDLSSFRFQIQTYDQDYFSDAASSERGARRHLKQQMFVNVKNQNVCDVQLERPITQIALTDCRGQLTSMLFSQTASAIRLFKMIPSQIATRDKLSVFQTAWKDTNQGNKLTLQGFIFWHDTFPIEEDIATQKYYTDETVYLYDDELFAIYRDRFIDTGFFGILSTFLNKYYEGFIKFNFVYDAVTDTLKIDIKDLQEGDSVDPAKLCFFWLYFPQQSILNGILSYKNDPGAEARQLFQTNLRQIFGIGGGIPAKQKTLYQFLMDKKYLVQTPNVDYFELVAQNYPGGDVEYQFSRHYTLSTILYSFYCQLVFGPTLYAPAEGYQMRQVPPQIKKVYYQWLMAYGQGAGQQAFICSNGKNVPADWLEVNSQLEFKPNTASSYTTQCRARLWKGKKINRFTDVNDGEAPIATTDNYYCVPVKEGNKELAKICFPDGSIIFSGTSVGKHYFSDPKPQNVQSLKLFQYTNDIYIYARGINDLIGVLHSQNNVLQVVNRDVWCWKYFSVPIGEVQLRFLTRKEDPNGHIIFSEGDLVPEMLLRFVVK